MTSVLSGIHFIMHSAGWQEGGLVFGMEKFMLDDDHVGMMYRMANGLTLDDNHLAMEAYQEIGPGNHYLGCGHTMKNYRTALHNPELSDSESYEQWLENGSNDAEKRAHIAMKKRLREYQAPPLDEAIDAKLRKYIDDKKASMPDALE
jgi:Trimethylamine:corrinoid methyltransferase